MSELRGLEVLQSERLRITDALGLEPGASIEMILEDIEDRKRRMKSVNAKLGRLIEQMEEYLR